jgi:xylulokinase
VSARALYLGLDVGTQGTKGLVLDGDSGRVLARAGASYGLIEGLPEGAAEQDPQTWLDAVASVARELWRTVLPRRGELRGIGVGAQQHGLVALDAHGAVVRPAKLWCDTATAAEAAELSAALGRAVPCGFTAPKVLWMARHEPELWARTRHVLLPHEFVNYQITGARRAEFGDASGTGWLDVRARRWDERALEVIDAGLRERLPELLEPGEPAGALDARGARLLGLEDDALGVPVAAGGGDNMMSALGAGAAQPGIAVVSLGTSATACVYSAEPCIDPAGAIAAFCDSTGAWLPLLCTMNATGVLQEVSAGFGLGLDELTRRAARVPAGCEGLRFLPFLIGERVPDLPGARGVLSGLRPGDLRPERVFRAALEGVTLNLAWGVERLRALGPRVERVRLVGGGASNLLWREILAACLGAEVECPRERESAALGAALQACWTSERLSGIDCSAHAIAARVVRESDGVQFPDARLTGVYAALLEDFRSAVGRFYGLPRA